MTLAYVLIIKPHNIFLMIMNDFIGLQSSIISAYAWMPIIVKNQNQLLLKIERREEI
jgi:hypothetical protein